MGHSLRPLDREPADLMTKFRSAAFTAILYTYLACYLIVFLPIFFVTSDRVAWAITKNWARSNLALMRLVVGTRAVFTGRENIPAGPAIIAAKHQSYWETMALLPELHRPTFILKRELTRIPLFGAYLRRLGMIPVDRARGGAALSSMLEGAARAVAEGRQIVIFPEGTRTAPGADAPYRSGVYYLYAHLGLPVVPVALNSGLFWPKSTGAYRAGTIAVTFLPPIPPGLDRDALLARLKGTIDAVSNDLAHQALRENPSLPVPAPLARRADA